VLARASLRVRVMAAAAVLVAVTSVLMGLLGTVLLRDYLFGRVDAQLRTFSSFVSRVVTHPRPGPRPHRPGSGQLPTDYLVEMIDAGGQVHVAPGSMRGIPAPALTAAQLHGPATPFTAAAKGSPGHSWRVLVRLQPVDLSSIAVQAAAGARAIQPGRPLTVLAAAPVIVQADGGRLRQVIEPTSRPATSTRAPATRSSRCSRSSGTTSA
jgi:hypothetical protein